MITISGLQTEARPGSSFLLKRGCHSLQGRDHLVHNYYHRIIIYLLFPPPVLITYTFEITLGIKLLYHHNDHSACQPIKSSSTLDPYKHSCHWLFPRLHFLHVSTNVSYWISNSTPITAPFKFQHCASVF